MYTMDPHHPWPLDISLCIQPILYLDITGFDELVGELGGHGSHHPGVEEGDVGHLNREHTGSNPNP